MSTALWILALLLVAAAAFLGGVAFGRGFWRDVTWIRTRR